MNLIKYFIIISIIVFSLAVKNCFADNLAVYEIAHGCSQKFPTQVEMFEKRNGMRFSEAVSSEAISKKNSFNVNSSQLTTFCTEMMGRDYSVISFSSKPQGAKILMDGDEQPQTTDHSFRYPQGIYKYEIRPTKGSPCSGTIELKKGKKYKLSCTQ